MHQQDAYERILASLHAATLDDTHWNETSALIDEACGSRGNLVVFGDGSLRRTGVLFARFCYRGQRHEEGEREYFRLCYPIDEHLPRWRQLPDSRIVHVTELFSEHEMKTSPIWNEAMAHGHQDSLKVRLDGLDESRIFWSFADPVDGEGWSSPRTDMIARLLPHLRQFLLVRQALVQAEALGMSLGAMLDNGRAGVVQLDRRRRIGAANDLALEFLRKGDGLFDEGGFLRARSPRDDEILQRLLGRAIPPFSVQGASGSMAVTRRDGVLPLVLHVMPVEKPGTDYRPQGVAALALIVDPRRKARIDRGLVAAMLGLTPTESEVAAMLAEGRTIREIATVTGRGESTIRWHLKHIFSQLGVGRQFEVARLVLSLGGAPPYLHRPSSTE